MKADPRLFQTKTYEFSAEESGSKSEEELTNDAEGTSEDTIIYELKGIPILISRGFFPKKFTRYFPNFQSPMQTNWSRRNWKIKS